MGLRYDVIDLDPYGTVSPFVDAAVQARECESANLEHLLDVARLENVLRRTKFLASNSQGSSQEGVGGRFSFGEAPCPLP